MTPRFYFADPDELLLHETKPPHGNTIYVYCRECDGTVMFKLDKRDGYCFSCESVIKLHKMYKEMSDDELCERFGVEHSSSRLTGACASDKAMCAPCGGAGSGSRAQRTQAPETISPGPLSHQARQYIASRGITAQTLTVLPLLKETTHWGKPWLCWRNVAGSYELRAIGGSEKGMPRGSTKTYAQAVIRPAAKQLVICEGVFSTLSYAQLHAYEPDIYITLNSVSVVPKMVQAFPAWRACGVEEVILALDLDEAGRKATKGLYTALRSTVMVRVRYPETTQGCDWNDRLLEVMPQ
jgi:hypothetical protein